MTEKTKKLSERAREVMDTVVDALESLLNPQPEPVPVRIRRPRRVHVRRR